MSFVKDMLNKRRSLRQKILFYIILTFIFIMGAVLTYITVKSENLAMSNAKKLAKSYAKSYANFVQDKLNYDMGMARAFGHSLYGFTDMPADRRMPLNREMMHHIAAKNNDFMAIWISWERRTFDTTWNLPYGRGRYTVFRQNGQLKYREEMLDLEGDDEDGAYFQIKKSKEETVINPYEFSYSGKEEDAILETSLCIPILKDNEFMGLAGMDINLENYQKIINQLEPIKGSKLYLLANNSTFVTHPDAGMVGESFKKVFPAIADTLDVHENIAGGEFLTFDHQNDASTFYTFAPIQIGETSTPWSLMFQAPLKTIMEKARRSLIFSTLVGGAGLVLLIIIVSFISGYITRPIKSTTAVLQKLAKGNLQNITQLQVKSNDELQDMSDSLNTLMQGLQQTAEFARRIGEGNLDVDYQLLSDNDTLGHALLDMQQSLKKANEDEAKRKEEEERQNWITEGLATFGDILRKNNNNINDLSYNIMKNLVDYIDAAQGCIYVRKDDDEENEEIYELKSAIAYDRKKMLQDTIKPGDGLVGRVVHEKMTIYMTDVPEDYVHISTGLGGTNPRAVLIVPLILNEEVFGALELVSFNEFKQYQIDFVEKIADSIASTVSGVKVTERTNRLLKESQHQREELSSQEEEMRQNLEELKATQEEAGRRESEMNALIEALGSSVLITEFDLEGKILNINNKCIDLLGIQPEKMVGKYHKSLGLDNTTSSANYKKLWADLNRKKTKKRISEVSIAGKTKYIEETYIPVIDEEGNIHKIVAIGYDFTQIKEKDNEIERLKAELAKYKSGD